MPTLTIGTGTLGGNYNAVGHAFARLARENQAVPGFEVQYQTSAGSVSNINALATGDIQFGIAQADHQYQAVNGLGEWQGKGLQADLRAVFSIHAEYVTILAGADGEIRSIADLRGKLVDIGTSNSGTQRNAIDSLDAAGIDWKNDIQVQQAQFDERLAMFMRGETDAFFFTTGHPSTELKFATFSVRGARFVSLENIDELVSKNPFYSRELIPTNLYPQADNQTPIETIGVKATLLTSDSVSEDVVYRITKTVFENLDSLDDLKVDLTALREGKFLEGLTAPIHAGALKYYDEIGAEVPAAVQAR